MACAQNNNDNISLRAPENGKNLKGKYSQLYN